MAARVRRLSLTLSARGGSVRIAAPAMVPLDAGAAAGRPLTLPAAYWHTGVSIIRMSTSTRGLLQGEEFQLNRNEATIADEGIGRIYAVLM